MKQGICHQVGGSLFPAAAVDTERRLVIQIWTQCLQCSVSGSATRHKEPAVDETLRTSGSVQLMFNLRLVSSSRLLILPAMRRCEKSPSSEVMTRKKSVLSDRCLSLLFRN